jgi:glutaredoxin
MKHSRTLLQLAGLLLLGLAGFQLGTHGSGWARQWQEYWRAEPDLPAFSARAGGVVVLVSSSTCPWCAKARAWLADRDLSYRECALDLMSEAEQIQATVGSEVPQLITPWGRVVGFDSAAFGSLLALAPERRAHASEAPSWHCVDRGPNASAGG